MTMRSSLSVALLLVAGFVAAGDASAQRRGPATLREFLMQYRGKEVQILDKTGGSEQFVTGEPSKAYVLTLNDVQNDYIIVSRDTESDKRSFVYPISVIRRVIYMYDGKPYQRILLEMY